MTQPWWIETEGRVWGPYPQARLAAFVAEQRLTGATRVGRSPDGPFQPASRSPELTDILPEAAPSAARERPLLVVADLRATSAEVLESALASYGPLIRVRPGLWLVRARLSPSGLRNAVSRRLSPEDMLMAIEAESANVAWFNLNGDTDRALRRLWTVAPSER